MRRLWTASVGLLVAVMSIHSASAGGSEPGIDRRGSDYKVIDLVPPTPPSLIGVEFICEQDCGRDSSCKAFTFVNAGVQGPNAKCWLKNSVPQPTPCSFCTSGVKTNAEPGIDRPGQDYKNFDLASANPASCEASCTGDRQCMGWTYVNPGVQGPNARCWLKTSLPQAVVNSCCTSGSTDAPPVIR